MKKKLASFAKCPNIRRFWPTVDRSSLKLTDQPVLKAAMELFICALPLRTTLVPSCSLRGRKTFELVKSVIAPAQSDGPEHEQIY